MVLEFYVIRETRARYLRVQYMHILYVVRWCAHVYPQLRSNIIIIVSYLHMWTAFALRFGACDNNTHLSDLFPWITAAVKDDPLV